MGQQPRTLSRAFQLSLHERQEKHDDNAQSRLPHKPVPNHLGKRPRKCPGVCTRIHPRRRAAELRNLYSYRDLVDNGISEDEELRVFEIGSRGDIVTAWAAKPLFLTTDPTLVGKWAELQAELAALAAQEAIRRVGG